LKITSKWLVLNKIYQKEKKSFKPKKIKLKLTTRTSKNSI